MNNETLKKILPIDASYVRSGLYADKKASQINESVGLPPERLVFKYAPGTDWNRYLVVRFNTDAISGKYLRLCVKLMNGVSVAESDVWYEAYPVEFEGPLSELTYNTG